MDQPAIAITTAAVRQEMRQNNALFTTSKPIRKTSSFEREGWWRITLTDTPIPGTYHLKTFIEESLLNPVIATYNFKNEGRKKPPLVQRNNPVINDIPQYMPPDFLDLVKKQTTTYSFKDKPRPSPSTLVYKDQSVQLSPGQYEILPAPVPKHASRGFVFRSTVQRFPTGCFTPSRVPRFLPTCSKTPGPGAYTSSNQYPKQPQSIAKMGREHSLFFNNTIGF
ncbi:protein STPG4 isoform X2 [Dasypus novemcinctus]|uniref:protein STPG4 isoform X2 n=1 Tax=Dasypus novemcinctus TaxID=9361 RepID=UPI0039C98433